MTAENVNWVCRSLFESPYCIGLCLSEKNFKKELTRLKVSPESWPKWITDNAGATVHYFDKSDGHSHCAIVCIDPKEKATPNEIVGLLIHEAVHVWQTVCENVRETNPSREFEAYSIQSIAQRLISAYPRCKKAKR
jgi:hypothetical protein